MSLSDSQLDRYARHIVLPEIGGAGQRKLLDAHVAVVGTGGIGSPAIQYLAAAGVGQVLFCARSEWMCWAWGRFGE